MTFNYSLLAFNWELLSQVLAFLMLASLAVGCVIGFTQGFRRIHWGGVAWALAAGSYSAVLAIAQEKMQSSGLVSYLIAAVACALVCLVGFAVLRLIIKPRKAKELNERNLHNYLREEDELREMERKELEKCGVNLPFEFKFSKNSFSELNIELKDPFASNKAFDNLYVFPPNIGVSNAITS